MKKKISLMGREFSVFAIAVVAMMAFSSAALVGYLSNDITGTADVDSPFSAGIAKGHVDDGFFKHVDLSPVYGGDASLATLRFEYLGNQNNVEVKELFTISSTDITCGDFDSIIINSGNALGDVDVLELGWCDDAVDNILTITDISLSNFYDVGEVNMVDITLNFKLNAKGTYTLAGQVVPLDEIAITPTL